jgi:Fic family protein
MTKRPEPPPRLPRETLVQDRALSLLMDDSVGPILRRANREYLYWDKVKYLALPDGVTAEDAWRALKISRHLSRHSAPFTDQTGRLFGYSLTEELQRCLMVIDQQAGGSIISSTPSIPDHARKRYLISNLMEEAIASSQLEGAATTRAKAKDMLRSGRKPVTTAERMISNNYQAILRIKEVLGDALSPSLLLELQTILTDGTCAEPGDCGRFRTDSDNIVVGTDENEQALYVPPAAGVIQQELERLCAFANTDEGEFVHPVIKAAILHFWLAYVHPFCDGNGRTARALFYWYMLRRGYWLFEYISISRVIHRRRAQYERAFLYSEMDDRDLTYFLTFHLHAIEKALEELVSYLQRETEDDATLRSRLTQDQTLNHRQRAVLSRALADPMTVFTIESHRASHGVVYATARADLLDLVARGYLRSAREGHAFAFRADPTLRDSLRARDLE